MRAVEAKTGAASIGAFVMSVLYTQSEAKTARLRILKKRVTRRPFNRGDAGLNITRAKGRKTQERDPAQEAIF